MKTGSGSFWKASGGLVGLIVVLVILVAVNIIIGNLRLRADLTEEDLYTLSEGSRNVLNTLDRPVTLKLFSNADAPEVPVYLKRYAKQVEDLLTEYKIRSDGKVSVEKYDPEPDSEEEEWARRYGISGQPLDMFGSPLYFGLVAVSGDREDVIPALDPRTEGLLEYHITRLVYRVTNPDKPVVGVLSSLPVFGSPAMPPQMPGQPQPPQQEPWLAFSELESDYDVREIDPPVAQIDPAIQALVVVHPKELDDETLFAIDQYVLGGGHLMLFVDPMNAADMESSQRGPMGMNRTPSNLEPLLDTWGVGYDPAGVVADFRSATRVRGMGNQVEDSPVWLTMDADNINQDDIITTQLELIMLPFAAGLSDETGEEVTFTPLFQTSDGAGRVNAMTAQFGSAAVRRDFQPIGTSLTLAARLTGTFRTAFPEGPPETEDDDAEASSAAATDAQQDRLQKGDSVVLVIADADMIHDRFTVEELNFLGSVAHRPLNDNLTFFANALEQLAGSTDLIGIRSRGKFNRPFDRVVALRQKAMADWQEREAELEERLRETQRQLREMEQAKDANQRFILTEQQQKAIEQFRNEEIRIKDQLKEVRKNLRKDIEALGVKVKVVNVAAMPLLVALAGIGFYLFRRTRQ